MQNTAQRRKESRKRAEKHATNANTASEGEIESTGPPSVVRAGSIWSEETEVKYGPDSLPWLIPLKQGYDPVMGKALPTILETGGSDDSMDNDSIEEFNFHIRSMEDGVPPSWLLLHSKSTCHVFSNRELSSNIYTPKRCTMISSNGGTNALAEKGSFGNIHNI